MSFMTTTMFAPRIWGFDFSAPRAQAALQAGWRRRDLLWEDLMEQGCAAWADGRTGDARRCFTRARWLTRLFPRGDLRRAGSDAALAMTEPTAARMSRRMGRAKARFERDAEAAIAAMRIAPRARSSLFHLRMEARHRDTYHANMRLRLGRIAAETAESLEAMARGRAPAHRLHSRWKGERPTVHDDTRKVLAACLLIPGG